MDSKIIIGGNIVFENRVHEVTIEQSWKNITQTARIVVPRYKQLIDPSETKYKIKPGDTVQILLGYDGQLVEEFTGYVSLISPTSPLVIECEDEMYKLKQTNVTMSWPTITLANLITYLMPEANVSNIPGITLTNFRLDKVSKAKALEKIKEEYGLVVYFRNGVLFAGLAYTEPGFNTVRYHFQKNCLPDGLQFKNTEDVKVKVKAISVLKNNKRLETEVGDGDGNQTTLHFYNITTIAELKIVAEEAIKKMRYTGYTGSFTGFGLPLIKHGDVAKLDDDYYPERKMDVFVDSVKTSYNSSGFRRQIEIGRSAA